MISNNLVLNKIENAVKKEKNTELLSCLGEMVSQDTQTQKPERNNLFIRYNRTQSEVFFTLPTKNISNDLGKDKAFFAILSEGLNGKT